jgi:transketolase
VLGKAPRIGCEAASPFGWYRYCQDFVGMTTFGASAPIEKLYEFFEITPVKLAARAKALVK